MKTAVVHDWLVTYAGAERVLEQILLLYPDADLFTICDFLPEAEREFLGGRRVNTTFIQRLPSARRRYRGYLPLMPLAIEQLDLSGYDLVLSSSHAVAKGVLTGPGQLHVSYVHTPIRYAWDLQHQYLREAGLERGIRGWIVRYLLHRIRLWDLRTVNGVDGFVANSDYIARRIRKLYRRHAKVIHPPVNVAYFHVGGVRDDYFLTASRLVPYKRIDLIVEAFTRMPNKRLLVIGDGPDRRKIEMAARNQRNIELLGYQPAARVCEAMQKARAFVFAAEEDFGIMPVEAQACGTPVIAFGRGGARETVVKDTTGLFFEQQTPDAIMEAVRRFERDEGHFEPATIRAHAEHFSPDRFRRELAAHVDREWTRFHSTVNPNVNA
ncbi:MAG TPA: glycosyltransferase family 4 protein [Gammaproteobacteria bacterium]|nr:glycosyltransferase family 4 protein [Gammaproteobacteria bacterium]